MDTAVILLTYSTILMTINFFLHLLTNSHPTCPKSPTVIQKSSDIMTGLKMRNWKRETLKDFHKARSTFALDHFKKLKETLAPRRHEEWLKTSAQYCIYLCIYWCSNDTASVYTVLMLLFARGMFLLSYLAVQLIHPNCSLPTNVIHIHNCIMQTHFVPLVCHSLTKLQKSNHVKCTFRHQSYRKI